MTRDEVRSVLGRNFKSDFQPTLKVSYDNFPDLSVNVGYKEPFVCNVIVAFPPARVVFQEHFPLKMRFKKLRRWIESIDDDIDFTDGIISLSFGIHFCVPNLRKEATNEPVVAIHVFEKGYFDDHFREFGYLRKPRFEE
jgi:hypothetical protein